MALVLIDGSSAIKDVNVSMGKGLLGLSGEMLPTSRDARSVPLNPLFLEVNRQIIETRDLCCRPTRDHRGTTSWLLQIRAAGAPYTVSAGSGPLYTLPVHSSESEAVAKVKRSRK
jgi:hypothetical protein